MNVLDTINSDSSIEPLEFSFVGEKGLSLLVKEAYIEQTKNELLTMIESKIGPGKTVVIEVGNWREYPELQFNAVVHVCSVTVTVS